MRPLLSTLAPLFPAGVAAAADAPVFAASGKGAAAPTGDPTLWLALAAVAMMATLLLAQRLVSRRRGPGGR